LTLITEKKFITQHIVKKEITPPAEILEEMRPLLEEFKSLWHHSASILHSSKDPFMRK